MSSENVMLFLPCCRCSGVVTGIGDLDPYRWPNSKWRCLMVSIVVCCHIMEYNSTTLILYAVFLDVSPQHSLHFICQPDFFFGVSFIYIYITVETCCLLVFVLLCLQHDKCLYYCTYYSIILVTVTWSSSLNSNNHVFFTTNLEFTHRKSILTSPRFSWNQLTVSITKENTIFLLNPVIREKLCFVHSENLQTV